MLQCIGVSKEFGGLKALKSVDFTVNENEITGLVGPNGSGKSTLLNVISGVYKPDSGVVKFLDEDISKLPPHQICARGITKTSQTVQSFPEMTSIDNVYLGALFGRKLISATSRRRAASAVRAVGRTRRQRGDVARAEETVQTLTDSLEELEAEFQEEVRELRETLDPAAMEIDEFLVRPRKSDISVSRVTLVWMPWLVDSTGVAKPAH